MKLLQGDCLELMHDIPDGSVDMVLCDLPYGTTKNKWDCRIDLCALWGEYKRIIKQNGCIALFAQTPFDKVLGASCLELLKYEWIWVKPLASGYLNCNYAPTKAHENILVFSKGSACYVKDKSNAMTYNPQMESGREYYKTSQGKASSNYDLKWQKETISINNGTRYPRDVLQFNRERGFHPTQKPVPLMEYLIKTYTNPGETVLDNCMGSGSTGVACVNTGRDFIGIELDPGYFQTAQRRIRDAQAQIRMEAAL